jgi:hypothetical protein
LGGSSGLLGLGVAEMLTTSCMAWVLVIPLIVILSGIAMPTQDSRDSAQQKFNEETEKVIVAENYVKVPIGSILLVRQNLKHGIVQFVSKRTGETKEDLWIDYQSWYLDEANTIQPSTKGELVSRRWVKRFGRVFSGPAGPEKKRIICGPLTIFCDRGATYFYDVGKQPSSAGEIELAPTKWTNINQVDVFDSRIRWYRYDPKRPRFEIRIDQLW